MEIGDRVRPVETFDFAMFGGPTSLNDVGTVIEVDEDGYVYVEWDNGDTNSHVVEGSGYHMEYPDSFEQFGVVPV